MSFLTNLTVVIAAIFMLINKTIVIVKSLKTRKYSEAFFNGAGFFAFGSLLFYMIFTNLRYGFLIYISCISGIVYCVYMFKKTFLVQ